MNLKWKPTQISLEVSRGLFGPDRAEITKRSNDVGPDVDDAIHNCDHRSTDYSVAIKIARTLIPYRRERGYSLRILIIGRRQTSEWLPSTFATMILRA
jgi:hypothetical protein